MDNILQPIERNDVNNILFSKNFLIIGVANFAFFFSGYLINSTIALYVNYLGGSDSIAGIIAAVYSISTLITRPFSGYFLDSSSKKIPVYLGLMLVLTVITGYCFIKSLVLFALLRMFHGIGWGLTATGYQTNALDCIPKSRRATGLGFYGLTGAAAMVIAPTVGLEISKKFGYEPLFVSMLGVVIVSSILARQIYYQPIIHDKNYKQEKLSLSVLFERHAIAPSLVMFLVCCSNGAVLTFTSRYGQEMGIKNYSLFFIFYGIFLAIGRPIAGALSDKYGTNNIIWLGLALLGGSITLLGLMNSLLLLLLGGAFFGLSLSLLFPSLQAVSLTGVSDHRVGAATGTFSCCFDVGVGLGAAVAGVLISLLGYREMFLLMNIFVVAAALQFQYTLRIKRKEKTILSFDDKRE